MWLDELTRAMFPWFDELGFALPEIRVSSGFPSAGRRARVTAEAWTQDAGRPYDLFVRPDVSDALRLAAACAQQIARIAAGQSDSAKQRYRGISIAIGLRGRRAESRPGLVFAELINPILDRIGPPPAGVGDFSPAVRVRTQSTRLIKVSCPECGYVARVTRKWLEEAGPPHCPQHAAMRQDSKA